jgi:hypothetical protein
LYTQAIFVCNTSLRYHPASSKDFLLTNQYEQIETKRGRDVRKGGQDARAPKAFRTNY